MTFKNKIVRGRRILSTHQDVCDFYIGQVRRAWEPHMQDAIACDCLFWLCSGETVANTRYAALMPRNWAADEVAEVIFDRLLAWEQAGRVVKPNEIGQGYVSGAVHGFTRLIAQEVRQFKQKMDAHPILACAHPKGAFDLGYLVWPGRPEAQALAILKSSVQSMR